MNRYRNLEAAVNRSIAVWKSGQPEESLSALLPLAKTHPKDPALQALIGFVYYDTGKMAEAIPFLEAATTLNPKHELAWRGLFHALWDTGDHVRGLLVARTLAKLTDDPDDRQMLADIEAKYGSA